MDTHPILNALAQLDGYATINHYGAQSAVARRLNVPPSHVQRAAKGGASLDLLATWATSQGLTVVVTPEGASAAPAQWVVIAPGEGYAQEVHWVDDRAAGEAFVAGVRGCSLHLLVAPPAETPAG